MLTISQFHLYYCGLGTITHTNRKLMRLHPKGRTTPTNGSSLSVEVSQNPAYPVSLKNVISGRYSMTASPRANSFCRASLHVLRLAHADLLCLADKIGVRASDLRPSGRRLSPVLRHWVSLIPVLRFRKTVLGASIQNVKFSSPVSGNISRRCYGPCASHRHVSVRYGRHQQRVLSAPVVCLSLVRTVVVAIPVIGQKFFASVGSILESLLLPNDLFKRQLSLEGTTYRNYWFS